ncbi:MAG: radical SAM protein [Nanoarchaeota archaeon]
MRIALIWPRGFDPKYVMPLSLGYLKSNLDPKRYKVKLIDCALKNISANSLEFRKIIEGFKPEVVGVSCWSPTYNEAINILQEIKNFDKKTITVIGGAHVTSYPEPALENKAVDFVFRGEAELSFPLFLKELEKKEPDWSKIKGLYFRNKAGELIKNEMERESNLDKIKFPDYDAMNLELYLKKDYRYNTFHKKNAPIWITRGCPYCCQFCSASLQNGKLVRKHSINYIIDWVKYLYYQKGIKQINIIDDNFTFDIDYAKNFCKAMIDLNLKDLHFGTPNGIRFQRTDLELLRLMKKAGWETLFIAPESGSVKTLAKMGKYLDPSTIPEKVKEIRRAGLKVNGCFIIGYPGETKEDLKETSKLIRKSHFNFFFLNNFQPLPGTPIYEELLQTGEIPKGLLPKDYSSGERAYTPQELKDFNFPAFVFKEYLFLALSNPINIPYMLKLISPPMIFSKVYLNLKSMIKKILLQKKELKELSRIF